MTGDEEAVLAATKRFYAAIDDMVCGRGLDAMKAVWLHDERVTSGHPTGDWAFGWDEVLATWEVFASFGTPEHTGSVVRDVRPNVYGDIAYTTSVFTTPPAFGASTLSCTNILRRVDGEWKIIHHHADKAPKMEAKMEKMAAG